MYSYGRKRSQNNITSNNSWKLIESWVLKNSTSATVKCLNPGAKLEFNETINKEK